MSCAMATDRGGDDGTGEGVGELSFFELTELTATGPSTMRPHEAHRRHASTVFESGDLVASA